MITAATPVQSLSLHLGAFMLDGAKVGPMPCGLQENATKFGVPIVQDIQHDGRWVKTMRWKDCGVAPILSLRREGGSEEMVIAQCLSGNGAWEALRKELERFRSMAIELSPKQARKKARERGEGAARHAERAHSMNTKIAEARDLEVRMAKSSDGMAWRTAQFGIAAASNVGVNPEEVERLSMEASRAYLESAVYFLRAGDASMGARNLYEASASLFSLERYHEAAMLAEAAWNMDRDGHRDWVSFAVAQWIFAADRPPHDGIELSQALRDAWSAMHWECYGNVMNVLIDLCEDAGDYDGAAAGYLRKAWAFLQQEPLARVHLMSSRMALDDAAVAWELAECEPLSEKARGFARELEKIGI